MDAVLAKAKAHIADLLRKKSELERRIERTESILTKRKEQQEKLDRELQHLLSFEEVYNMFAEGGGHLPGHGFRNRNKKTPGPNTAFLPGSNSEKIEAAAIAVLAESAEPLQIAKLLELVQARGVHVNGKRPRTVLAAVLSRSGKVYYHHPFGWQFVTEVAHPIEDEYARANTPDYPCNAE